jgi:MFS superfamily sulfate permease-like transporter
MSDTPTDTTGRGAALAGAGLDGLAVAVPPVAAEPRSAEALRWLPGLKLLQEYRREWLRQDVVAGLVLTAVLVPVGMAYAEAAGLPPITGLYATLVPLIAYAIFGPSRILVLGPDSSLAGIIAAVVLPMAAGDPARAIALAGMLAILTGLICVAAGLFKLGFITDLLSKPIRYGYINGIALTVIVGQLPKLFGFSIDATGLLPEARAFVDGIRNGLTNGTALLIGVASLATILGCKRFLPRVPGVLVAVVGATAAVGLFGLAERPPTSGRSLSERSASRSSPLLTRACSRAPLLCGVATR